MGFPSSWSISIFSAPRTFSPWKRVNEKFSTTPSAWFPPDEAEEPESPEYMATATTATSTATAAAPAPPSHIRLRRRSPTDFLAAAADRLLVELLAIV
jgi:hypothetical protein